MDAPAWKIISLRRREQTVPFILITTIPLLNIIHSDANVLSNINIKALARDALRKNPCLCKIPRENRRDPLRDILGKMGSERNRKIEDISCQAFLNRWEIGGNLPRTMHNPRLLHRGKRIVPLRRPDSSPRWISWPSPMRATINAHEFIRSANLRKSSGSEVA